MRKTALFLMAAGALFLLDTVSLEVAGIDLLLAPVGFLLIFNGARPLARFGDRFAPCVPLCLALVALSALELFLPGQAGLAVAALRYAGQAALLALMARGLAALPDVHCSRARTLAALAVPLLNALAALGLAALGTAEALAGGSGARAMPAGPAAALLVLQLALPATLVWLAFTQSDTRPRAGV